MFERFFVGAFAFLMAVTWVPALTVAQPAVNQTLPRLSLPISPERYPAASVAASEEGHVVLVATIGVDGQMSNARIETSSGHSRLDAASIVLANDAHLSTPPTNAAGEPVSTDVFIDLVWELPLASAPDGLQLDPSSEFAVAYFSPGADFGRYDKLILEGPEVTFREGWRRQHVRATLTDMTRISQEQAEWFREVFVAALQGEGGYQIEGEAGEDVLSIRAGIADLDVVSPILVVEGPGYSLAESGTTATLVLELSDSVSGEVLARAFDRQRVSSANFEQRVTRFTNESDARTIFSGWAEILRTRLVEDRNN